jgi:hypothetical protein
VSQLLQEEQDDMLQQTALCMGQYADCQAAAVQYFARSADDQHLSVAAGQPGCAARSSMCSTAVSLACKPIQPAHVQTHVQLLYMRMYCAIQTYAYVLLLSPV